MAQLIPEELIIEILQRLPVKSLLRFRCISKSLRSIIDSPNFINTHLSKSSQTFNPGKLIFWSINESNFHVCDLNFNLEEEIILRPQISFSFQWKGAHCVGSCNGLLLFHKTNFQLALLNPSTRQFKDLPICPCEVLPIVKSYLFFGGGLGYDDSIDDYKILNMVSVWNNFESEIQVWVYELRSNIWRRSQNFSLIEDDGDIDVYGYFADGNLYFLCEPDNEWKSEIVAFDIRKEIFSFETQVPVCSISSSDGFVTELHVLGGCLCIGYVSKPPGQADLYIRKKDDGLIDDHVFTWTKLFSVVTDMVSIGGGVNETIMHSLNRVKVLGYVKRGDNKILIDLGVVNRAKKTIHVVSYDHKDGSFVKVETEEDPIWDCSLVSLLQIESLVSVGDGAVAMV